jgi:hypothetical protein
MKLSYKEVKEYYIKHGATWEDVNIFGLRNEENQDEDIFNDYLCVAFNNSIYKFEATCDPGKYWTLLGGAISNRIGVAHICYGYHKDVYIKGYHRGKKALVQRGNKISIWRDKNKNYQQDIDEQPMKGYFGVNIHGTSHKPIRIGKWSAGCLVIKRDFDFMEFMNLISLSKQKKFSLYLFNINQFNYI